jgi:UDP-N-acetylglucosamine 3-dehydrogenase
MKIGLAIVGAGSVIQGRHLPALATIPEVEVRAVFDPDRAAAERAASMCDARIAASLEDAVTGNDIQAVTIASPNSFHRIGVEAAAAARKHIFCEKPIATTLQDARAILEAASRAAIVLQIGFHHRFTGEFRAARRLLETGAIGEVRAFQAVISEPLHVIPGGATNYRLQRDLSGGLTLIDFGSHRIDQLRALLGEFAQVAAKIDCVGTHGLDDNIALLVETRSRALGTLAFQRFSQGALSPTTLIGTKGVICYNAWVVNPFHAAPVAVFTEQPLPPDLLAFTRPADWWTPPQPGWTALWPPGDNPYAAEYRAFFDSIRNGSPPAVTGEDGYRTLEIVLAAYKSFHEKRAVNLPLNPEEEIAVPSFLK